MNFNDLAFVIHENAKSKGFWDVSTNIPEKLMLIVSEVSEALEAHRHGRIAPKGIANKEFDRDEFEAIYKDTFNDEIADTIIRLLDLCGHLKIDIDTHIKYKMKYNVTRERLHGKKY